MKTWIVTGSYRDYRPAHRGLGVRAKTFIGVRHSIMTTTFDGAVAYACNPVNFPKHADVTISIVEAE